MACSRGLTLILYSKLYVININASNEWNRAEGKRGGKVQFCTRYGSGFPYMMCVCGVFRSENVSNEFCAKFFVLQIFLETISSSHSYIRSFFVSFICFIALLHMGKNGHV